MEPSLVSVTLKVLSMAFPDFMDEGKIHLLFQSQEECQFSLTFWLVEIEKREWEK
jgi:hypothetical protein